MLRRKKLKTNGSSILSFSVNVKNVKRGDAEIKIVSLNVTTNDGEFAYEICKDTRAPDLVQLKSHLETSLQRAKTDFLNVEISEYTERNYLFFDVQTIDSQQYTGRRL